jgi:predicted nucleic acid-binding protein
MLRVVADANVLVSAAIARSPQAPSVLTLDAALDGRVELVTSPFVLREITSVLSRQRLRKYVSADEAIRFVADLPRRPRCWSILPAPTGLFAAIPAMTTSSRSRKLVAPKRSLPAILICWLLIPVGSLSRSSRLDCSSSGSAEAQIASVDCPYG